MKRIYSLDAVKLLFAYVIALGHFGADVSPGGGINYPLWQLCALAISGYFIYGLLCLNEKLSRELVFPAAILSLVSIFVFKGHRNIHLITFTVFLLALYDGEPWINRLLNREIFKHCADFSYAIYLNHALIKVVLNAHILPRIGNLLGSPLSANQRNVIYLLALTVYSMLTLLVVNRWKHQRKDDRKERQ